MLKKGNVGADVKTLQEILGIPADGIFGSQTENAVLAFQKSHNLVADGIWGPASQAAFDAEQQKPVGNGSLRDAFLIAIGYYGIKEIDGSASNPIITQFYADVGQGWVKDDAVAWCAAFVGSCLEKSGISSTKALNAKSYLNWGTQTVTPLLGDICVFNRGADPSEGHVAFFVRDDGNNILILGGNQGNSVSIISMPKSLLVSYRTK